MKTLYWHSTPGIFVNMLTGNVISIDTSLFNGTQQEWWETFWETCIMHVEQISNVQQIREMSFRADIKFQQMLMGCVLYSESDTASTAFISDFGNTVEVQINGKHIGNVAVLAA